MLLRTTARNDSELQDQNTLPIIIIITCDNWWTQCLLSISMKSDAICNCIYCSHLSWDKWSHRKPQQVVIYCASDVQIEIARGSLTVLCIFGVQLLVVRWFVPDILTATIKMWLSVPLLDLIAHYNKKQIKYHVMSAQLQRKCAFVYIKEQIS